MSFVGVMALILTGCLFDLDPIVLEFEVTPLQRGLPADSLGAGIVALPPGEVVVEGTASGGCANSKLTYDSGGSSASDIELRIDSRNSGNICATTISYFRYTARLARTGKGPWRVRVTRVVPGLADQVALDVDTLVTQ